jgi:hypothetical protein
MKFIYGQVDMNEIMHVMDGDGKFHQNVTYIDTDTGDIGIMRMNRRTGKPILMPNPPKDSPYRKIAQVSMVQVPTPITLVFNTPEDLRKIANGVMPHSPLRDLVQMKMELKGYPPSSYADEETPYDVSEPGIDELYEDMMEDELEIESTPGNTGDWTDFVTPDAPGEKPMLGVQAGGPNIVRHQCPCCGERMVEKYSTQKKWYLKCPCGIMVLKVDD